MEPAAGRSDRAASRSPRRSSRTGNAELPLGRLCGRNVVVNCAPGSALDLLRRDQCFGSIACRGQGSDGDDAEQHQEYQLVLSLEEALFLTSELRVLAVADGCSDVVNLERDVASGRAAGTAGNARSAAPSSASDACVAATAGSAAAAAAAAAAGVDAGGGDAAKHAEDLFQKCCASIAGFPRRYASYHRWRLAGWIVRPDALKFGADFLLYDGKVDDVHARYAAIIIDRSVRWSDVIANSRLAETVAKELLVVAARGDDPAESPVNQRLVEFLDREKSRVQEVVVRRWHAHLS